MNTLAEKEKNIKKVKKLYKKLLKQSSAFDIVEEFGIELYLINYLKYLRDTLVLKYGVDPEDKKINAYLLELVTALTEYAAAQSCFFEYFKNENGEFVPAKEGEDEETAAKAYVADKTLHMRNFWYYLEHDLDRWRYYVKLQ